MATVFPATDPYATGYPGEVIPPAHVRLSCGDPALTLVALLGPDAPQLSGGFGGWTVVGRPRDVGMTIWEGVEPFQLSLSIMLDGWTTQRSQEAALRRLYRVARGDKESPPGVLVVEGLSLPADQMRWVIEGLDFGEPILALNGSRLRQPLTLSLREYIPPSYARRNVSIYATSSKITIVRAQKGDTPAKIAKRRRLKSWTVIRDLNAFVTKANQAIKTGTKVRVPATKRAARSGGKDRGKGKGKGRK